MENSSRVTEKMRELELEEKFLDFPPHNPHTEEDSVRHVYIDFPPHDPHMEEDSDRYVYILS